MDIAGGPIGVASLFSETSQQQSNARSNAYVSLQMIYSLIFSLPLALPPRGRVPRKYNRKTVDNRGKRGGRSTIYDNHVNIIINQAVCVNFNLCEHVFVSKGHKE